MLINNFKLYNTVTNNLAIPNSGVALSLAVEGTELGCSYCTRLPIKITLTPGPY